MFINSTIRTLLIWVGVIMMLVANSSIDDINSFWLVFSIGFAFNMSGCYIWTRLKNRHWAFMFWGILSPIGLLGISLIKNKHAPITQSTDARDEDIEARVNAIREKHSGESRERDTNIPLPH